MTSNLNPSNINELFEGNDFLDQINPTFAGTDASETGQLVAGELRFRKVYLGGDLTLPPGTYSVYLRKSGTTADGRANVPWCET